MNHSCSAWSKLNAKYLDGVTLCSYCDIRVADSGDHVVPRSRFGSCKEACVESNYVPACMPCNRKKSTGPAPRNAYHSPLAERIGQKY